MSIIKGDLIGRKFGRLTVVKRGSPHVCPSGKVHSKLTCRCDCGKVRSVLRQSLRTGNTQSCGCLKTESVTKHGKEGTKIYGVWGSMLCRCNNPRHPQYADYGERGIRVCMRWHKFENFYADMGDPPRGKTLDRRDNNGIYEKANCRWASRRTQQNNRRTNVFVEYNGERRTVSQWARKFGLKASTLYSRLYILKWAVEKAFTTSERRAAK